MTSPTRDQLQHWLEELRQGTLPRHMIFRAVYEFGEQGLTDAQPDVQRLLADADPEIRRVALQTLTVDFRTAESWEAAARMLVSDPDEGVQMAAAAGLGALKRGSRDPRTLQLLARVVKNGGEDKYIREAAYEAMLSVLHYDPGRLRRLKAGAVDLESTVDWALVDSCAADGGA